MSDRAAEGLLLVAFAALGAVLVHRAMDPRPAPPAGPGVEVARAAPAWVVPPGREEAVTRLLRPALDGGVSGRAIEGIRIEGDAIRAALEGGGALRLTADGVIAPELEVAFIDVEPDAALRARLGEGDASSVFVAVGAAPAPAERSQGEARSPSIGILGPATRATGMPPWLLIILALGLGAALAALAARSVAPSDAPRPPPRPSAWVLAAVVVAVGLRGWLAAHAPLETDEVRPLISGLPLLSASHDAWLHPPLYRALLLDWIALTGWSEGDPAIVLRLPSLVASALAALGVTAAAHRAAPRLAPLGAFAALVGADFVLASVLARPYALLAALAAAALWAMATGRVTRGRAAVALCAAGLAWWVDVLGGAMLTAAALAWLSLGRPRSAVTVLAAALALGLFAAPVAVGAVSVARAPGASEGVTAEVVAAQRPERGMGRGQPHALVFELASFSTSGIVSLWWGVAAALAIGWVAARGARDRPDLVVALALVFALAVAAGATRSVRPRNLLVLPTLLAPLVAVALRRLRAG